MNLQSRLHTWAALRAGNVKPRTREYHREIIEFIGRAWPEKFASPADAITESDLALFIARISRLSATRFNAIVTMLRAALPAAVRLRRRRVQVKERPILSQLEFSRLLGELEGRPRSHSNLVIRFLAHTGLRISEARQLRWENVNMDKKYFFVPGQVSKSGRPRAIPFVNGVSVVLEGLREASAGRETILPQAEAQTSLRRACERAGLPRLSHHSFRHHFATRCIEAGVDVPTVARWLGHQDGGALLSRVYFHLLDEHSRQMAEKVEI
ncbi:MAG: site-specific integrase [Verrucomicrobiota bacterium]|nr:site-specific integrase [Verrucomicrobiota bacterium]